MSCNCCISPDQIKSLVQAALYSEITAGNLQAPLLSCNGTKLGAAKVPSCDEMTLAISEAVQRMQPVIHDSTLSGYGSCQSPLTVNQSWLAAFVQNLADTMELIHIGSGGGISGTGTTSDPLTLDIQNDGSLSGKGTEADPLALAIVHDDSLDGLGSTEQPLKVDVTWLDGEIKEYLSDNGINVAAGSGLSGNGSSSSPLSLDINHDESLDGDGTSANPLKVDPEWLASQIDNTILKPSTTVAPTDVTETDSVSTVIVGGTTQTLGKPDAYVQIGNYLLPAYNAPAASTGG